VDGVSATDAWAVGVQRPGAVNNTLAEHWGGSSWSLGATPNVGIHGNVLTDVSMVSSTKAWAVGNYSPDGIVDASLVIQLTGTTWSVVPSPNPGDAETSLNGVSALSSSNAWAVGEYSSGSEPSKTLVLHWNGLNWTQIPSPSPGSSASVLNDVSAISPTNVWATGILANGGPFRSLVEHWNGTTWKVIASPNYGTNQNAPQAVDAISAKDVWVVGFHETSSGQRALLLHWNGTKFTKFDSTTLGNQDQLIREVDDAGTKDVWAVGSAQSTSPAYETLALHWNGKTWKASGALDPGDASNSFTDVFTEAHSTLLAVGSSYNPVNALAETKCP
jgi:hypothetical protein